MAHHSEQNLSHNDPTVRKYDRILMKQWWVCACESPKATSGEVWKREMIKGRLCTVENRAIIGRPALSLPAASAPQRGRQPKVQWGQCVSLMYRQIWKVAEPLWHWSLRVTGQCMNDFNKIIELCEVKIIVSAYKLLVGRFSSWWLHMKKLRIKLFLAKWFRKGHFPVGAKSLFTPVSLYSSSTVVTHSLAHAHDRKSKHLLPSCLHLGSEGNVFFKYILQPSVRTVPAAAFLPLKMTTASWCMRHYFTLSHVK